MQLFFARRRAATDRAQPLDRRAEGNVDEEMPPESQRPADAELVSRLVAACSEEGQHLISEPRAKRSWIEKQKRPEHALAEVAVLHRRWGPAARCSVQLRQYIRYGYRMRRGSALDKGHAYGKATGG